MKEKLAGIFEERFGRKPAWIVRSPGRVNIIGEHTDYNKGFVLPAAIDKAAWMAIGPAERGEIRLYAADLDESYQGPLENVQPLKPVQWPNYILGVVAQFQKRKIPVEGFCAVLMSDIPIGAGLSSSAAIECATAYGLQLLNQQSLERMDMVKLAQKAEHEFAGVLCGIMDQFASMMGKKDHAMKLDCDSLQYEYVPLQLKGYKLLLLNTNVRHSLASSEYNTRRLECERAVSLVQRTHPQVQSLRDVSLDMVEQEVEPVDPLAARRARFIVQEIARLQGACEDLKRGDLAALGQKMWETHDGLSEQYAVSCPELDWLVDFVRNKPSVLGARMMGGGFGGCTINLVKEEGIDELLAEISQAYEAAMKLPLTGYVAGIENGTEAM